LTAARTVLVTGAAGNLGTKLRRHLEERRGYDLRLLDRAPADGVIEADLAQHDEAWARHFEGVDAVVHLAAHPSPRIDFATAQALNVDLTFNVFDAAALHGVRRMIFASSNWVMAGYRFAGVRLTTDLPPRPINPYGISKWIGERAGQSLVRRGLSFVALRIGYCQKGENRPGPHMGQGLWGQQMWLSDHDFVNAVERAVLAEGVTFAVLNLMSDNPGMPWDIDETRRVIGYDPKDGHEAEISDAQKEASRTLEHKYALDEQLATMFEAGKW